jgi:hypothetical protein
MRAHRNTSGTPAHAPVHVPLQGSHPGHHPGRIRLRTKLRQRPQRVGQLLRASRRQHSARAFDGRRQPRGTGLQPEPRHSPQRVGHVLRAALPLLQLRLQRRQPLLRPGVRRRQSQAGGCPQDAAGGARRHARQLRGAAAPKRGLKRRGGPPLQPRHGPQQLVQAVRREVRLSWLAPLLLLPLLLLPLLLPLLLLLLLLMMMMVVAVTTTAADKTRR